MNKADTCRVHVNTRDRASIQKIVDELYDEFSIIQSVHRKPWTFVELEVIYRDRVYFTPGFAKVRQPDQWDLDRGLIISVKDAMEFLAQEIFEEREREE